MTQWLMGRKIELNEKINEKEKRENEIHSQNYLLALNIQLSLLRPDFMNNLRVCLGHCCAGASTDSGIYEFGTVNFTRKGKMYLDFLQNQSSATLAASYSVRPKPGANVSMPIY